MLRNPRAFAFLLIAAGLGLAGWYGDERLRLPEWTDAQREETVDLRLAAELQHRGPLLRPDGERLELLRRTLRAELDGEIRRQRQAVERWIALGAFLCVLGLGHFVRERVLPRAGMN